jgi:hypothetical protein
VWLLSGASPGLTKAQPVCLSDSLSGRVRCQVGWVTDKPTTSCRPCCRSQAHVWDAQCRWNAVCGQHWEAPSKIQLVQNGIARWACGD